MKKQRKNVQDMKTKNIRNSNKGITLIALVITIIVLLILAGVSIATLTGENGILTQAQNSKTASEKGEAEEKVKLVLNEWQVEKYRADAKNLETFLNSKVTNGELDSVTQNADGTFTVKANEYSYTLNADGILTIKPGERATATVKDNYTDGTKTATIPAGYTVSNIEGEKTIDGGLVIYEIPEGTTVDWTAKNADGVYEVQILYNQFVWIPATTSTYKRNIAYEYTVVSTNAYTDKDYLPTRIQPSISNELITKLSSENAETKINAAKQIGTLNETAKTTAKNANSNYALCSGIQWDVTMAFVNGKPEGANPQKTFNVTTGSDSRHIGGDSVAKSGNNEADLVANIYDLEGNAWEYVAEKNTYYSSFPYVSRGGHYINGYSASYRDYSNGIAYTRGSFRFTLYAM